MGEAPMNYLAFASTTSDSGSGGSSSASFSGKAGPETAVKAAKYGATFEKSKCSRKEWYVWGGGHGGSNILESKDDPIKLDCSGFVSACFNHVGLNINGTTWTFKDSSLFTHVSIPSNTTDGMEIGDCVLPNSQFGDVAVLDISNSGTSDVVLGPDDKTKSKLGIASPVTSNSAVVS